MCNGLFGLSYNLLKETSLHTPQTALQNNLTQIKWEQFGDLLRHCSSTPGQNSKVGSAWGYPPHVSTERRCWE